MKGEGIETARRMRRSPREMVERRVYRIMRRMKVHRKIKVKMMMAALDSGFRVNGCEDVAARLPPLIPRNRPMREMAEMRRKRRVGRGRVEKSLL
jgi:hypothetical protein